MICQSPLSTALGSRALSQNKISVLVHSYAPELAPIFYLRNKTSVPVFYSRMKYRYEFEAYELKHECELQFIAIV